MSKLLCMLILFVTVSAKGQGVLSILTLAQVQDKFALQYPQRLNNSFGNKALDVEDGIFSGNRGIRLQLYTGHGPIWGGSDGLNQLWYIIPSGMVSGKQTFRIMNAGYMNFITAAGSDGFAAMATGSETNEQKWFFAQDDFNRNTNNFYLLSAGLLFQSPLANYHASTADNARVGLRQFTSDKTLFNFGFTEDGVSSSAPFTNVENGSLFTLWPKHAASKNLDVRAGGHSDGTAIQLFDAIPNNGNQIFKLERHTVFGFNQGYSISASWSSGVFRATIQPAANGTALGTPIVLQNTVITPSPSQQWLILPILRENGYYAVFNYNNGGRCLDVTGMGTTNTTTVQLWNFQNNNNQKWLIKRFP